MRYLIRTIKVDPSGTWYTAFTPAAKAAILRTFDAWIRQPGQRIDLIRTSTGTPIYFEALENGHYVCQIEYQLILKNVKR